MRSVFILLFVALSFGSFAQTTTAPEPAATVMKTAFAKAKSEHKNVILMFHASWCGWCKKMDASISDPVDNKFFEDNYVIVHLDVMEHAGKEGLQNPGGMDVMNQYGGNEKSSLPYWLVLDASGKALGSSLMPPADGSPATARDNVGCPAADNEVAYFAKLLKSTSKMTDEQLAVISTRFAKNAPVSANH